MAAGGLRAASPPPRSEHLPLAVVASSPKADRSAQHTNSRTWGEGGREKGAYFYQGTLIPFPGSALWRYKGSLTLQCSLGCLHQAGGHGRAAARATLTHSCSS